MTGSVLEKALPEEEEEAPTQKLHVRAQLDELIEEPQDVWDVGEGQHQQRLLQLTEEKASLSSRLKAPRLFFLLLLLNRPYPFRVKFNILESKWFSFQCFVFYI